MLYRVDQNTNHYPTVSTVVIQAIDEFVCKSPHYALHICHVLKVQGSGIARGFMPKIGYCLDEQPSGGNGEVFVGVDDLAYEKAVRQGREIMAQCEQGHETH